MSLRNYPFLKIKNLIFKPKLFPGAMIDILGGYASSITRAMLSFCVPKEELGKIYSVLSFIDGILPFAVSEVYAQIWIVRI